MITRIIGGIIVSGALVLSACSPAAQPAAQSGGSAATAAPAKPAAQATTAPAAGAPQAAQPAASGAKKPTTVAELAAYTGPDRQQILEEGARSEGKLSQYWTLAGDVIQQLPAAFMKKYPYVNVEVFRGDTGEVVQRITSEAQANKNTLDVASMSETGLMTIREAKIITPFYTPAAKDYKPEAYKAAPGGNGMYQWIIDAQTCFAFAYNTNLLPESAVPKTYKDLLNPALKGKMTVASTSTGVNWVGNLVTHQGGPDIVKQLGDQNIQVQAISGKAILDLIASGEVVSSPTIYESHTRQALEKGAPVKWVPLDPVTCSNDGLSLAANAPHPHAALLYIDFLLSPEAQKIVEDLYYNSPAKPVAYQRWSPESGFETAADLDKAYTGWQTLFKSTFVGR